MEQYYFGSNVGPPGWVQHQKKNSIVADALMPTLGGSSTTWIRRWGEKGGNSEGHSHSLLIPVGSADITNGCFSLQPMSTACSFASGDSGLCLQSRFGFGCALSCRSLSCCRFGLLCSKFILFFSQLCGIARQPGLCG